MQILHNGIQGSFANKDVVNLFRRNIADSEISFLSQGLTFVLTSKTIDKSKLEMELGPLGRILYYNYSGILEMKKTSLKSTFNPRNKDLTIEI